ncbi:1-acylglycerophosphocholine O-acyltransferase 1 [Symbiodinium microadriaticum]|uniref:1-acylglycerophosphocholine O-acyltransferase 1 n=1 Tax=Symbiodinium microadriaticum TaxID=2951 RepID=A0A1Q9EDG1_SYMMI|nr:1-acylglycerophosphocholine O-acyltransferase 1 [Symbiodinium microadriaticum]
MRFFCVWQRELLQRLRPEATLLDSGLDVADAPAGVIVQGIKATSACLRRDRFDIRRQMADSDPNVFLSSRTDTSGEGLLTKQSDSPAECEETSKRSASSSFQSCAEEEAQPTDPGPAQPLEEEQRSRAQTLEVAGVTCEILRAWYGLPNNPTRQVNATQYCRNAWSNTTGLTMSRTCYNRVFERASDDFVLLRTAYEVLKSLVRQSRKPDAVYLSVPYFFARSWSSYNHPWWYEFLDPIVHVLRCEQDFRSNTGLLCILQYELAPDTRILMVDDDQIYHPLLLQQLLSISSDIPGSMIGAGSYHRPGIACFKHNSRGMCAVPNLIHTTYGILYQRRFFDHGIFNFAAAVRALQRALPSKGPSADYVLASCMIEDNVWWESHLARKGVPRVFLRHGRNWSTRGCGTSRLKELSRHVALVSWWEADHYYLFTCTGRAFQHWRRDLRRPGALEVQLHYLHALSPPAPDFAPAVSSNAFVAANLAGFRSDGGMDEQEMCGGDLDGDDVFFCFWEPLVRLLQATQAAVAEVPVAAIERDLLATFPKPETSFSSGVLAERRDDLLKFTSSLSTMPVRGIAAVLSERLVTRVFETGDGPGGHFQDAILANFLAHNDAERSANFSSEPFDHEAFLPAPLSFKASANELPHNAILHAPPHAPGRPSAGSRRPLVDVVEFCAASAPAPAKRAPELPPCGNFQAWILKATCWGGGKHFPRNRTWQLRGQTIGNCFSSSATFYHARHICRALNATLPTSQQILGCCSIGCYGLSRVWLSSEVPECYQEYDSPPPVLPFAPAEEPIGVPTKVPDRRAQEELARAFLRKHEEARSTEIEWDPLLEDEEAVTNMFGATVAASGYVVGKTLTSLQNAVTSDPDNSVADSTIFQTAFSTWLRCNGIVPSVSYDPIPGGTAAPEDMRQTPIILCNHTCYLDGMVLASVFHAPKIIAKKGTLNVPLIGAFAADLGVIEVDRSDPKSRAATIQAIEDHVTSWKSGKQPLLLFPEGTTSNGQHLLEFKKGAFVPGVTVRPAVLYYSGSWDPANVYYRQSDDGKIQAIGDTEWAEQFLGHMMHSVRIRVLPPYKPSQAEKQDAQLFANNVREVMSKAHGELRQAYAHRGVEAVEDVLRYTVGARASDFFLDLQTGNVPKSRMWDCKE